AASKRDIAQNQQSAMQVFKATKAALDKAIVDLDKMKLDIDLGRYEDDEAAEVEQEVASAISAEAAVTTLAPPEGSRHPKPPPPPTPAQWAPDPHGRHELRYWDGTQWTEHVATRGVQSTDQPG